jgi:multicomponent Na+:H+ antiporter subunit D
MDLLLILPFAIPLFAAVACVLFRESLRFQRLLSVLATFLMLGVSLVLIVDLSGGEILALRMGGWAVPMGIVMVADMLAAIMLTVSNAVGALVLVYSLGELDRSHQKRFFYPLYLLLLMGVNGSFLSGDIFNLYVWFEIMLLSSFVLLALGRKPAQIEGALKYVVINLFSSMLFLSAVGILYGKLGTLNMADLAVKLSQEPDAILLNTTTVLFMAAFGIKAGLFPLFFWLPASYHTPAHTISAVFAGLLTKVGVYALIRFFTLFFTQDIDFTHTLLLVLAVGTMVSGVLGAAAQFDFKRILSFHIISQIGYMIVGLGLMSTLALAGAIFYIVHHIIVKTNLFLIAGIVDRIQGSTDLKRLGGLYASRPWLAVLFFIPAFSLGGIPPLSGFWAKFSIIKAGLAEGAYWVVAAALLVGILTLFSMTKIWGEVFWKKRPEGEETPLANPSGTATMFFPVVAMALITLLLGFFAQPFFALAELAAEQLLDPGQYIEAVMGRTNG